MARPAIGPGVKCSGLKTIVVSILAGQALAAFAAHTIKLRMPETGRVRGATLNVGLRGGTHVTSALDIQDDGVSILAATFDVDALTPGTPVDKEGTDLVSTPVAKDSVLSIVTTEAGGTAPTWADATVQIDYEPLAD